MHHPKAGKTETTLAASIERVTYHQPENGFCVLQVKTRGREELLTVTGNVAQVTAGQDVHCTGKWIQHPEYGQQFQAEKIAVILPDSLLGMEKYLGSGLIRGVGPHFAKKLVHAFGKTVFDVIEHHPARLLDLPGIGKKRQSQLTAAWQEQKSIREIMVFLQGHGLGTSRAVRIFKVYGEGAIETVRRNPYQLVEKIRGIGFKTADQLATSLAIPPDAPFRVQAGLSYTLQQHTEAGHCAMAYAEAMEKTATLLAVSPPLVQAAIQTSLTQGHLHQEDIHHTPHLFLKPFYLSEKGIAHTLHRLMQSPPPWMPLDVDAAIHWLQRTQQLQLSSSQHRALQAALCAKCIIITGGPGVGKTTLVNSLLRIIRKKTARILLCAPTGRAAKRLSESTQMPAKTIHRLLEFDPQTWGFKKNQNSPLETDLLVVDESSMIDLHLFYQLIKAVPQHAALIIIGDKDQLPSVGPGAILADLMAAGTLPVVALTEVFRQAKTSKIITNAHRVNTGKLPLMTHCPQDPLQDFYFIPCDEPEAIPALLMHLMTDRIPKRFGFDPLKDMQVLTPLRRGCVGTQALNTLLQRTLNPQPPTQQITHMGQIFSLGDRLIQQVNNYDKNIYNGDMGRITKIDRENSEITVHFDTQCVTCSFDELDEMALAYATTVHKSQGAEYDVVIMPLCMQHYMLLERNLIYTGITRAKKLMVIIGQKRALALAVRNQKTQQRTTQLTHRIQQAMA